MKQSPPMRLLLVEDEPAEALLVREMLAGSGSPGFDLEHVDRVGRAVARLGSAAFDVVLLDFCLPDSAGIATFRAVHAAAPSVPVVILTNLDDEELAAAAVAEGAQDYLVKRRLDGPLLWRALRYAIARGRTEQALRESEERYHLAVAGANDGIWDWDLRSGRAFFSPRWLEMLGLEDGGDSIELWFSRIHPEDLPELRRELDAHLAGARPHFESEHRIFHAGGQTLWVRARGVAVRDASGQAARLAGSFADVTARKRAEQQVLFDAFHDGLTQLPNRALFLDRLRLCIEASRRRPAPSFAVLFVDLDRFKNLNDTLGHSAGDAVLIEFARRLHGCLRPGDTVARLGGDEFGILLPDVGSPEDAGHVAGRVHEALRARFHAGGTDVVLTASIGITLGPAAYERPEEVLRDADTAMYRAKAAGRACSQLFDEDMHATVAALLKMEMDLRRAVETESFVIHYQPIVALDSGRIVGFESLVRWVDADRGLIPPARFLAVAEETGLIVPIGWWVLEQTCRQLRLWHAAYPGQPPLYASVNVSSKLFAQPGMADRLRAILEEADLDPCTLRLEVTESLMLEHSELAQRLFAELRALGIRLAVDDFGTGYSSLSYLHRFSYDTLKIDRSFVADMDERPHARAIVEAIVTLADILGMNVVAEGVETAGQAARLREMNCSHAQGFWFSRPVDVRTVEGYLGASSPALLQPC